MIDSNFDQDFVVVGSGFGGSVSGLRLVEKGYRVLMLEQGSELHADDFPRTNWDLRRWLWAPALGCRGLFQMRFFRNVTVLAGAGVGGGSLVYANTLPVPSDPFFENPSWSGLVDDWKLELHEHYNTAKRMLGVTPTPFLTEPDRLLRVVAEQRGTPDAFHSTQVAVYFGDPDKETPDPYFSGAGPPRRGCVRCGACMTGCPHDGKNTLDKNYLYLARKQGLRLQADCVVVHIRALENPQGLADGSAGYEVTYLMGRQARRSRRQRKTVRTRHVVMSAGALGTVELLLRLKQNPSGLPRISEQLGRRIRTNAESLIGITIPKPEEDLSRGIAIGSILNTDEHSHVEVVRYGAGSGFFRLGMAPHVGGSSSGLLRLLTAASILVRHPIASLRAYLVRDWAKQTIVLLYMRSLDGTLRFRLNNGLFSRRMGSEIEQGEAPTASISQATQIAQEFAEKTGGVVTSLITETVLNIPSTAHLLGGCSMGTNSSTGVIDHRHQVFGYQGLYVIDGSSISANPGVNPSLTITALAERAMSLIETAASKASEGG